MPTSRAKDLADFIAKQSTDSDAILETGAMQLPAGTTAQRPTVSNGMIRYNTTLNLAEYYDGTGWKSIDSPPVISSISPSSIAGSDSDVDITITGSFFASGATVKAIGQDLSEIAAASVTFNSATEIVANFDGTSFADAQEDYDIEVTNPSGLSGKGNDLLAVNASPVFTTAAGSLGTIIDSQRSSYSLSTAAATDSEGASLTYAVASGSIPSGLSLNTSTGAITGTADAVGSDTTSTFTISASDGTNTNTRQFTITVNAPVITSYTSTGSFTYSVPSGITAVDVLVVAGGGGGGADNAGGGGAGGLIYRPAFPVTPGGSVSGSVGDGGNGVPAVGAQANSAAQNAPYAQGQDSTFGSLTAKGGGVGASSDTVASKLGGPGGSGGGGAGEGTGSPAAGGTATQPQQPGDSGTYGFGNPGGVGNNFTPGQVSSGGGGGGAGATGGAASNSQGGIGGAGGNGKQYGISGSQVYYAGGGAGGHENNSQSQTSTAGGQGGGGRGGAGPNGQHAQGGTANRGGGGGGGGSPSANQIPVSQSQYPQGMPSPSAAGGAIGGSGIVIVSY